MKLYFELKALGKRALERHRYIVAGDMKKANACHKKTGATVQKLHGASASCLAAQVYIAEDQGEHLLAYDLAQYVSCHGDKAAKGFDPGLHLHFLPCAMRAFLCQEKKIHPHEEEKTPFLYYGSNMLLMCNPEKNESSAELLALRENTAREALKVLDEQLGWWTLPVITMVAGVFDERLRPVLEESWDALAPKYLSQETKTSLSVHRMLQCVQSQAKAPVKGQAYPFGMDARLSRTWKEVFETAGDYQDSFFELSEEASRPASLVRGAIKETWRLFEKESGPLAAVLDSIEARQSRDFFPSEPQPLLRFPKTKEGRTIH